MKIIHSDIEKADKDTCFVGLQPFGVIVLCTALKRIKTDYNVKDNDENFEILNEIASGFIRYAFAIGIDLKKVRNEMDKEAEEVKKETIN